MANPRRAHPHHHPHRLPDVAIPGRQAALIPGARLRAPAQLSDEEAADETGSVDALPASPLPAAARIWADLDKAWREAFRQIWEAPRSGNIAVGACASTPEGEIVPSPTIEWYERPITSNGTPLDVQEDLHPGRLDLPGQGEVAGQVVVAGRRVHPQAHPHVVRAGLLDSSTRVRTSGNRLLYGFLQEDLFLNGTGVPPRSADRRPSRRRLPGRRPVRAAAPAPRL